MDSTIRATLVDASHEPLLPIDLSHHYSKTTKNRNASSVKDFYKYFSIPNIGNLAGGTSSHSPPEGDRVLSAHCWIQRFDALAMGFHWLCGPKTIRHLVEAGKNPRGFRHPLVSLSQWLC